MTETIEQLLTRNLHGVFGERDPAKRRAAIESLYAPTAVFADHARSHVGWDGIETAAAAVQDATPGFVFTVLHAAEAVGDAGRLRWGYGPAGAPARVTGSDIAVVRDGRITALYVFLDG